MCLSFIYYGAHCVLAIKVKFDEEQHSHLISISLHTSCITLMTSIKQDNFHITLIQRYASYFTIYTVCIWDDLYGLKVSCISI